MSDLNNLDQIHGAVCNDCHAIWIHGFDPEDLGLDSEVSDSMSGHAESFAECVETFEELEDTTAGYFDCLICNTTDISGQRVIAYMEAG